MVFDCLFIASLCMLLLCTQLSKKSPTFFLNFSPSEIPWFRIIDACVTCEQATSNLTFLKDFS